jgi:hypothetical protein
VARLLGLRVLKLDARVMLLPADVSTPSHARSSGSRRAAGRGLADAVRCLNEGAAILSEARRDGAGDT